MDIKEKSEKSRNAFERLLHTVPGFKGYYNRESRRDADKVQRSFLVGSLRAARDKIQVIIRAVSRQGRLDLLTDYDAFLRNLDKIINQIEYSDRGYSAFFDLIKIKENELDEIYRHDVGLVEDADGLAELLENLADQPLDITVLSRAKDRVKGLDDGFRRRQDLLTGCGKKEEE